jgi:preprotein translocase subunit SecF
MNIVGKRRWFYLLSAVILIPSIISLIIPPSLFLGIEFTGGSTISIAFQEGVAEQDVRDVLSRLDHAEAIVQPSGGGEFFIRVSRLREGNAEQGITPERETIQEAFEELAPISRMDVSSVSGVVAADTVRNAFIAVVVAAFAILLYITWAFRQVPNPFRYGVAAIIALIHDVLIVVGIFSILGKVINLEVNAMFITGLLTIIGYSVNDTIVVFDRIRENVARLPAERLEKNVNTSLLETLGRSLNTSVTLLITVLALLLLGGETIRNFLLVLLIGLMSGTYSSIAIASQVLVSWESGELGRTLRRFRPFPARSRA